MRPNWFIAWPATLELTLPPAPSGVRVFHPADRHVTLAFLGGVDEAQAQAAWAVCADVAPSLQGRLTEVRPLGARDAPSLTAIVEGLGDLEVLTVARDLARLEAGLQPEERALLAHVTLARMKRGAREPAVRAGVAWAKALPVAGVPAQLGPLSLYTWSEARAERLFRVVRAAEVGVER